LDGQNETELDSLASQPCLDRQSGSQANTLVDNTGVVQVFGVRNNRMAQELTNLIGWISPEEIMKMAQVLPRQVLWAG
jgi:hypothetical protein